MLESNRTKQHTSQAASPIKLAPFHILAAEGNVYADQNHVWHMEQLAKVCALSPVLLATPYRVVDVTDPASEAGAILWWEEMTASGGEGMVVKPFEFITSNKRSLIQPAVKCRGREYLRIIYGPEYTAPEIWNGSGRGACPPNARWLCASSLWVLRRWRGLCGANRCDASMNACSACWRWRASRLIPGFELQERFYRLSDGVGYG